MCGPPNDHSEIWAVIYPLVQFSVLGMLFRIRTTHADIKNEPKSSQTTFKVLVSGSHFLYNPPGISGVLWLPFQWSGQETGLLSPFPETSPSVGPSSRITEKEKRKHRDSPHPFGATTPTIKDKCPLPPVVDAEGSSCCSLFLLPMPSQHDCLGTGAHKNGKEIQKRRRKKKSRIPPLLFFEC